MSYAYTKQNKKNILVLLITPFCVLVAHFVHEKKKKKNTGIPYIAYLLRTWYFLF